MKSFLQLFLLKKEIIKANQIVRCLIIRLLKKGVVYLDINVELMTKIRSVENIIKRKKTGNQHKNNSNGRIITVVHDHDGMTQSQLADYLSIRPQSLTRALSDLEKEGLIYRKRDEKDHRIVKVFIDQKGRERYETIALLRKDRASKVFKALDEQEKQTLRNLLAKIIDTEGDDDND